MCLYTTIYYLYTTIYWLHTFNNKFSGCVVPDVCEVAQCDTVGRAAHIRPLVLPLYILNHQLGGDDAGRYISPNLHHTHH